MVHSKSKDIRLIMGNVEMTRVGNGQKEQHIRATYKISRNTSWWEYELEIHCKKVQQKTRQETKNLIKLSEEYKGILVKERIPMPDCSDSWS